MYRAGRPAGSLWRPERAGGGSEHWRGGTETRKKVSTELREFFQLLDSCTFPWPPSSKAYLLIFQVHDFLPNYLSSTPQSRSTMQLRSHTVTLGLGCSWHCRLCQYSALESQENSSLKCPSNSHEGLFTRCHLKKDCALDGRGAITFFRVSSAELPQFSPSHPLLWGGAVESKRDKSSRQGNQIKRRKGPRFGKRTNSAVGTTSPESHQPRKSEERK